MPSFGRRGILPTAAAPVPAREPRRPAGGSWSVLKLAMLFGFSLILLGFKLQEDGRDRALGDYTPGARYDIGPAQADPACPQRRWSIGDYLPDSCFKGQMLVDVTPIGLENARSGRRSLRSFYWIRSASDVLLVDCPVVRASCRVWTVVRDRLALPSAPADRANYSRPTRSYLLGAAYRIVSALMLPLIILVVIAAWLCLEAGRRQRTDDPV